MDCELDSCVPSRSQGEEAEIDIRKNEIRECWYRGLVRMEKGEVHIELAQAL